MKLNSIEEALAALREGKPVIVADADDRENEGDAIISAELASPEWIAWIVRNTTGFLCVPMEDARANELELPLMTTQNRDPHSTNYTITVDATNRFSITRQLYYSREQTKRALDLCAFINGLPLITFELKNSLTKQTVDDAVEQYKRDRDPRETLFAFGRCVVHFAVDDSEVRMCTALKGTKGMAKDSWFLPFNQGWNDGAGNPPNPDGLKTDYLWKRILTPARLTEILENYAQIVEEVNPKTGKKKQVQIFPRYHQLEVVRQILADVLAHGAGKRYLIQHSAGSGKSNSIAWLAHQLSSLYKLDGKKQFDSVIVVTDRTVLDAQLQDTIYQFEHTDGVVGRINNKEGDGSKSEKLAGALESAQPIIIVTIQTFPHVLKAIENSVSLKERCYAIIADEAHSSQSGSTARQLKEVLMKEAGDDTEELDSDDIIAATVAARRASGNLSYFAFTATPKAKTLELFGRVPRSDEVASVTNKPAAFHVYSMRQAIEEGFILDVLKNYTNYKVAYKLALKVQDADSEVESKRAKVKLNQWVRLHDHNIAQKVMVIVEHFKDNVMGLLGGQAKAMVVTSSRKEAVRYKQCFDKYIADKGYQKIRAMVAFSGEVLFTDKDPNATGLIGEKFTESNMNPNLKGRDMRKAFDSDDYQVMIVANKFQTGFDQPKLCAMYVDKKLAGVECVQTLSRLNRTYPNKAETGTFVLDFFNDPDEILEAFQPYFQTAELLDVSDPNLIFALQDKLRAGGIFTWQEVEQFCTAFYVKNKSNAAIANICKPAVQRWQLRYKSAVEAFRLAKEMFERTQKTGDAVLIANAEKSLKECQKEKDALEIFKKDLGTFVRFYEFMSQIVDYDDTDLEKLSLYARNLRPMLRETLLDEDDIDLGNVVLSHYRVAKIRQQDLLLKENTGEYKLEPGEGLGTAKPKDRQEEYLSQIINRLNEVFVTDQLTDKDMVNYAYTIRDKVGENIKVMKQIENNSAEQALLGDFSKAIDDAILDSSEAHQNQMMQLLADPSKAANFARIVFDLLVQGQAGNR